MVVSEQAVDIALSHVLSFGDASLLCAAPLVSRSWRRTFTCLNAPHQALFRDACLQRWPWLEPTFTWSHCGHHLWHRYCGNWQALCCDGNRANAACTLELFVPLVDNRNEAQGCVQGPWVQMPCKDFRLRINAYPVGNRRMTATHVSAYLEVQGPPVKAVDWHVALDFTFVTHTSRSAASSREASWSSGPVRFVDRSRGGGRLDWGCHELLPIAQPAASSSAAPQNVTIRAHVALQEALVEVVHADHLWQHANDFGLCTFRTFQPMPHGVDFDGDGTAAKPLRLSLPASTTEAELLALVERATQRPVSQLRRFSRSLEAHGRLACCLPETPRHLLAEFGAGAAAMGTEDGPGSVYALLTKWTLGESSGGSRQNYFRFLAEGDSPHVADPADVDADANAMSGTARVYVKLFTPGVGLRFAATVNAKSSEDVGELLPGILAAVDIPPSAGDATSPDAWCLVSEGSPSDWADLPRCCRCGCAEGRPLANDGMCIVGSQIINGRGPLVRGDIVTLCARASLPDVVAIYQGQYRRRVNAFVSMVEREARQPGSCRFAELSEVLDNLNVDPWRVEQLLSPLPVAPTPVGSKTPVPEPAAPTLPMPAASGRPLLALLRTLPGLHPQFFCDGCGARELRGCRFNCLVCSDFDLCAACRGGTPPPPPARLRDHGGRCHDESHRTVCVRPALPEDCLVGLCS
mmetsp:Transcript_81247/g.159469  ORF Transcript_81247/g.159469 Transcript_81247/m.159469 type:complete len:692 (-) Transcript_81247:64-2139(-)